MNRNCGNSLNVLSAEMSLISALWGQRGGILEGEVEVWSGDYDDTDANDDNADADDKDGGTLAQPARFEVDLK